MAQVQCPKCGKTNPAEAATCQYCRALLKPGSAARGPARPGSQPAAGAEDTGWLRGLLGSDSPAGPADESGEQPVEEAEDDSAEWLERIRQRTQEEQDALSKIGPMPKLDTVHPQDAESFTSASELENWLKSLEEAEGAQPESATSLPSSQVPPAAAPLRNAGDSDDEWLRSLTARIEANQSMESHLQTFHDPRRDEPEQAAAEPGDTGEGLDWLKNFQAGETGEGIPTIPGEEPTPGGEPAGWLKELGQVGDDTSDVSADDLPDWVKNLAEQDSEASAPEPAAAVAGEIPEWLRELRGEPPAEEPPAAPAASPDELPEWLRAVEQPQGPAPDSASAEELPDWLKDVQLEQPTAENLLPAQQELAAPVEELPDWLKNIQPAEEAPSQPEPVESLPDWLTELTPPAGEERGVTESEWIREFGAPAEEKAAAPSPEAQPGTPDWLSDSQVISAIQTGQVPAGEAGLPTEPPEEAPLPPVAQPEAETPDWLKDIGALPVEEEPAPVEPLARAQPAAETPDWLGDFGSQLAEEEPAPVEPLAEARPAVEAPDWLKDFGSQPGAKDEPSGSAESFSGWLDSVDEAEVLEAQAGEPAPEEAVPAEDIPDWLKVIKAGSQPAEEPASPFAGQELPDWMSNPQEIESKWEEPSVPEEAPVESETPMTRSEMDALLEGVELQETALQPEATQGEGETLEPAQLPAWLQAMRPVEMAVSDIPAAVAADEQRIEKSGPLAGLRGVLPVEELTSSFRKPPVYINKLQVSEKQHLHSNLLESILADETRTQPVPGEATRTPQTIIRLLVAALLVFLVYVPALTGFNLAVPADLAASQPGVAQTFQSLSELAPGANILLAADFEAGLSGEITTAALPVLKYLQTRQPNVFIVSTVPAGPVLGEMLLSQASLTPVASFSYVAGGTHALKMIGMRASSEQPAPLQRVIPFPYGQGWVDEALQGIQDIASFQRILLVTDSLENARAWVEQVQPGLGPQTQILIVSSAQVAPLVRTYVESGQVSGLVSGLAGGAAFEQLSQQSGPGGASWTAYQLTMGAVILLVIAGALASGISSLLQPEKSKRKV